VVLYAADIIGIDGAPGYRTGLSQFIPGSIIGVRYRSSWHRHCQRQVQQVVGNIPVAARVGGVMRIPHIAVAIVLVKGGACRQAVIIAGVIRYMVQLAAACVVGVAQLIYFRATGGIAVKGGNVAFCIISNAIFGKSGAACSRRHAVQLIVGIGITIVKVARRTPVPVHDIAIICFVGLGIVYKAIANSGALGGTSGYLSPSTRSSRAGPLPDIPALEWAFAAQCLSTGHENATSFGLCAAFAPEWGTLFLFLY